MHRRAAESDIIIVKHHLFFADLALRQSGAPDAGILPEFSTVIFDEAHELEDVASNYFGVTVSNLRFEELARDIESTLQRKRATSAGLLQALARLRERARFFFGLLPVGEGRFAFSAREEFLEKNGEEYDAVIQSLGRVFSELEQLPQKPEEVFSFARRAQELQTQLTFIMQSQDKNTVFWIDWRGESRKTRTGHAHILLQATPIDVSQILKQTLFDHVGTAVLTSAPLPVAADEQSRF